jgi:hypothetical protein
MSFDYEDRLSHTAALEVKKETIPAASLGSLTVGRKMRLALFNPIPIGFIYISLDTQGLGSLI